MKPSLPELAERVVALAASNTSRVIVGITGVPGAGKTTLALALVERLSAALGEEAVAHVPMDGFHLADVSLERLGRRDRKGAPDTFDAHGYLSMLRRLRENTDPVVFAPGFDRDIEQPIAGSIGIPSAARVLVTEGNYLLFDGDWAPTRELLDEVWFVRPDDSVRLGRLLARHVEFGKTPEFAAEWIKGTDEPNADLIYSTIERADLVIEAD